MSSLKEVTIPEDGLLILFTPNAPGAYQARMAFNPGDMDIEDIKFYVALGQGLMHVATKNTDEITAIGVGVIEAVEAGQVEQHLEPVNNDAVSGVEGLDDIPGMVN